MATHYKRMVNTIMASGEKVAHHLAWRDSAAKKAKRKAAKASRRRNRK